MSVTNQRFPDLSIMKDDKIVCTSRNSNPHDGTWNNLSNRGQYFSNSILAQDSTQRYY